MAANDFFGNVFLAPAWTFSKVTDLLLGSYKRNQNGDILRVRKSESNTNSGLFGTILDVLKYSARAVSNFIYNHQTAIAIAFWSSLALAGAAALTVFLWPAALAAVTTFSIYGVSIASLVGTGLAAQVGAVAALTAAATSSVVFVSAAIVNTLNAVISFFSSRSPGGGNSAPASYSAPDSSSSSTKTVAGLKKGIYVPGPALQAEGDHNPRAVPLFAPLEENPDEEAADQPELNNASTL